MKSKQKQFFFSDFFCMLFCFLLTLYLYISSLNASVCASLCLSKMFSSPFKKSSVNFQSRKTYWCLFSFLFFQNPQFSLFFFSSLSNGSSPLYKPNIRSFEQPVNQSENPSHVLFSFSVSTQTFKYKTLPWYSWQYPLTFIKLKSRQGQQEYNLTTYAVKLF